MRHVLKYYCTFLFALVAFSSWSQTSNYFDGNLRVSVAVFNPCNGANNGSIRFTVLQTGDGLPATLNVIVGPPNLFIPQVIAVGSSFLFNNTGAGLPPGNFDFIISPSSGADVINTFSPTVPGVTLTALPTLTANATTTTDNFDCVNPNGQAIATITGGSLVIPPASFNYTWTSSNGLAGLPLSGTFNGVGNLNLASLLGRPGLPGGTYTLQIADNYSTCTSSVNFVLTDPSPTLFSITSGSGAVCTGANFSITLSGSEASGTQYEVLRNGNVTGLLFPGTGASPFTLTFPTTGFANGDVLTVIARNGTCTPRLMSGSVVLNLNLAPTSAVLSGTTTICEGSSTNLSVAITGGTSPYSFSVSGAGVQSGYVSGTPISVSPVTTTNFTLPGLVTDANGCTVAGSGNALVTVDPRPTITLGAFPSVCEGTTSALLPYTATTGSPDQFSIVYGAAALAAGFVTVTNQPLGVSPITLVVPAGAAPAVYTANLTIRNSTTTCSSASIPFTITVQASPTITMGAFPSVCQGTTTANLTYTATTQTPTEYSLDFDAVAEAQLFADVTNAALPVSPIGVTVPAGAAPGVYNATLRVRNAGLCVSSATPVTVTVIANPTITPGANPSVCAGVTTANLTYTSSGSPDRYTLNFDGAAEAQGFADVNNVALPASPIVISVPAGAAGGTYNATLQVQNTTTGCISTIQNITVTIVQPTITLGASPSVCEGITSALLPYTATTGSPDQFSIVYGAAALAAGFINVTNQPLGVSPITLVVPAGAAPAVYTANLTIRNSTTTCSSASIPFTITVQANPTITMGAFPSVCQGTTTANLTYTATTQTPTEYSLDFDAVAEAQLFADVTNSALPVSPIGVTVPAGAAPGVYNATLRVRNAGLCVSVSTPVTITVNASPVITPGANPSVCAGVTTANLTYTSSGSPDRYTLNFDGAAEAQGFVDVNNVALPASPIAISVPAGAVGGTYNATLQVQNTATGCFGASQNISITVIANPTITPGVVASICQGTTTAAIPYGSVSGSPSSFSLDFDAAANLAGLADVVDAALPASPISVAVPGAISAGTYAGQLTVKNAVGCGSTAQPITITVNANPVASAGNNSPVCAGGTLNLTSGGGSTYSWTGPNGFTSAVQNPSILAVTTAAGGVYSVQVTGLNGCSVTQTTTVTIDQPASVDAGLPQSVCGGGSITLAGTIGGSATSATWSGGTGAFAPNATTLNASYTPSPAEVTAGTVTLTLTTNDPAGPCAPASSNITITLNLGATANAGPDQTICAGSTVNLAGTFGGSATSATWSGGTGSFVPNAATLNAVYTPSPVEVAAGTVTLTLTTNTPAVPCVAASSNVTITINPVAVVNAGSAQLICGGTAVTLSGTITGGATSATWSGGGGTFTPDAATLNAVYTPTPAEVAAGFVTLTLTTNDPAGPCPAASSNVAITITGSGPTASAGSDQTSCASASVTLSGAIAGGAVSGTWSGGAGSFAPNATTLNAVYTPTPAEIGVGTVTLTLTTDDPAGPCVAGSDTMVITFIAVPTASAGPAQSICAGGNVTLAGGVGGSATGGTWSGGAGTFAPNANTLNAVYTPSAAEVSDGSVTLTLTTVGAFAPCTAATSTVIITISPLPGVPVISGTSICSGLTATLTPTGGGSFYNFYANSTGGTPLAGGAGVVSFVTPALSTTTVFHASSLSAGCESAFRTPVTVTVNSLPAPTLTGSASVCQNATGIVYTTEAGQTNYVWAVAGGTITAGGTSTSNTATVTWTTAGSQSISVNYRNASGCQALAPVSRTVVVGSAPTAALSGTTSVCSGQSATLTLTLTGTGPWDVIYSDGSVNTTLSAIATSPHTFSVTPAISTTYNLVSVASSTCTSGSVSGTATVTVTPIPGNPATFGTDTWIGYVYNDDGDPTPLPGRINFSASKYRGFVTESEIPGYNAGSDVFDYNLGTNPITGSNICGSFTDDFSIRFRMRKNFAAGIYRFTVGSDDGVRLLVNGVNVITDATAFNVHPYTVYTSAPVCFTGTGTQDLVIEYYERGGGSRISFAIDPVAAPLAANSLVCINSSAPTLQVSPVDPAVTEYRWFADNGLTAQLGTGVFFTPTGAQLDLTVAGTSDFFVAGFYGCGLGPARQVDVQVINSATITVPAAATVVCRTGGNVDLTTLVSATPAGGSFSFSGTGVTTSPTFNPSLVTGSSVITVNYTSGACSAAPRTFQIDVTTTATITVPAGNVVVCQTSGAQNLLTLVSATPAGGTFTFSGTGVSGSSFNPTGLSGLVTINVSYSNGGCSAPPRTFRFDVVAAASLETSTTTVCPTDADVDLTTLVTATPPGGTFTFSGAPGITGNIFDPTPNAGTSPIIAISYVLGGCSATGAFQVTVRAASDPLCGGGGGGGTGTCATVVVTPLPSPATCTNSDGRIIFRIKPFVPAVNPDGVRIEITGVSPTNQTISRTNFNDSTFTNLPIGTYDYEIDYGSAACKKTGQVTIDRSGTIGVPVATNVTSPTCFGEATGSLRLDVPGETGNVLQWSFDGGVTDPWKNFSAGNQVTGIPAGLAPTFQRVISVRRNATDPCFSSVVVAIPETASAITANLVPANASCNNNDGSITVTGLPVGTFTFRLNGTPITLPANGVINNLVANNYTLRVTAASGCFRDFTANVTFPGFVPTTTPVVSPPDCTGGGLNGTISFSITAPGAYTVGFTQDPVAAPTNFFNPGGLNVTIPNLTSGFWYIWIRPAGVFCETKLGPLNLSGTVRVAFQLTVTDEICFGSQGSIQLTAIQGAPNQPFAYELIKDGAALPTAVITFAQSVTPFTIAGLAPGNYRLVLTQNQSSLVPACTTPIASAPRTFRITGPSRALDTLAVEREISLPDQATGSMRIGIQESTFEPYEVRVELISPVFPSQSFLMDWRAAARNPQTLRMELVVNNLYAGVYKVSLRDANGCLKEYEVEVKVDTALFVPNIFTPNGDGFNDTFFIRNLPSEAKLEISNRWGKSVYQSNAYQNDWDANGISEGLYFYRLSFGDQAVSGWVEILRGRTD